MYSIALERGVGGGEHGGSHYHRGPDRGASVPGRPRHGPLLLAPLTDGRGLCPLHGPGHCHILTRELSATRLLQAGQGPATLVRLSPR